MIDLENLILREARLTEGPLGEDFFNEHILVVKTIALGLAKDLDADIAVVEAAALLHDIAAVRDYRGIANHHVDGAAIARALLTGENYPPAAVAAICDCIERHSSPVAMGEGSPEAVCISNADALAQMTRPNYWLYYAYRVKNLSFTEGMAWYRTRLESHRALLIPRAAMVYGNRYESIYASLYGKQ